MLDFNDLKPINDPLTIMHIGMVVDNNDPLKLKRVRCIVPNVIEGDVSKLPWIHPENSGMFGGISTGDSVFIPENGSKLYIVFPYGEVYYPFYKGSVIDSTTKVSDFDTNYPNRYGWTDSKGNKFIIDKTAGTWEFTHFSGTKIKIDTSGNVSVGQGGYQYVVLEELLRTYLTTIVGVFNGHGHPTPAFANAGDPLSVVPVPAPTSTMTAPTPQELSSKKHKVGD
jgi:hypothetical protein